MTGLHVDHLGANRADPIHHKERAAGFDQGSDLCQRIQHAGTCLVVDHGHHIDLVCRKVICNLRYAEGNAPGHFDQMGLLVVDHRCLVQSPAKLSVRQDQNGTISDN